MNSSDKYSNSTMHSPKPRPSTPALTTSRSPTLRTTSKSFTSGNDYFKIAPISQTEFCLYCNFKLISQTIQNTGKNFNMNQPNKNSINSEEDSFQQHQESGQQMQKSHAPSAIPITLHPYNQKKSSSSLHSKPKHQELATNYDLTFKKHQQFQPISNPEYFNNVKQNLFTRPCPNEKKKGHKAQVNSQAEPRQLLLSALQKSNQIQEIFKILRYEFPNPTSLLTQLSSLISSHEPSLSKRMRLQIQMLKSIFSIRSLRKKKNSAKLNMEVMKISTSEKDCSDSDKKRLQLLSLLILQIQKKLMIEGLKYNRLHRLVASAQFVQSQNAEQYEANSMFEQGFEQEEQDHSVDQIPEPLTQIRGDSFEHDIQVKNSPMNTSHTGRAAYYQQARLAIFSQIISSFINKVVYPALKKIGEFKLKYAASSSDMMNDRNLSQKLEIEDQMNGEFEDQQEENQISEFQHSTSEHQQSPIDAIQNYIETLAANYTRYPKKKQQKMRNYFLRWKIFFLRAIIGKIQPEDKAQSVKNEEFQKQESNQRQFISNKSIESALKEEKFVLKQYLRQKRVREFFKLHNQRQASQQIKKIMKGYREKTLQRRAFQILFRNKEEQIFQKYCEYIAENQNEQEGRVSQIYHKTSTLFKAFFGLKKLTKYSKFVKICDGFFQKCAFRKIKYETNKNEENETKIKKLLQRRQRQVAFKCFSILKNQAFPYQLHYKADCFKKMKEHGLMDFCFSALSLAWKKKMALQKRVQNSNSRLSAKFFFRRLAERLDIKYEERNMELKAAFAITLQKKISILHSLKVNYVRSLEERRIQVKATKLQIERTRKVAKQKLKEWRKETICRNNYKVIEIKLKKIKQIQAKQKMMKIWHSRLMQKGRQKRKDKLTQNHKIWLNKYYQKLCTIEGQQTR